MAQGNRQKAVESYLENLGQSQNLYLKLHWLEIGLRNTINRQLTSLHGEMWFLSEALGLGVIEKQQIQKAIENLKKNNKTTTNDNLIATLSFGFWVNLFNSPYENLWRVSLRKGFSGCSAALRRKELRSKLHPILKLRNRIAHYEPIIQLNLKQMNLDIDDIIGWIKPEVLLVLQDIK